MNGLRLKLNRALTLRMMFLCTMAGYGLIVTAFTDATFGRELTSLVLIGFGFCMASSIFSNWDVALKPLGWSQIVFDAGFATFLSYFTGGIHSIFLLLYPLNIVLASSLFSSNGALAGSLFSVFGIAGLSIVTLGAKVFADPYITWKVFFSGSAILLFGVSFAQHLRNKEKTEKTLNQKTSEFKDLQNLYLAIVKHMPSGIIYLNESGEISYMNPSAEKILGENLVGQSIESTNFQYFVDSDEWQEAEVSLPIGVRTLGHHCTKRPEGDKVIIFEDLTELRNLEKRVAQNQRMAAVGQLAAGVAHEIRNPLASLSGSIQLLKDDLMKTDPSRKLMEIVFKETDRLDSLANDFLNYAKPSNLNLRDVNLSETISEFIQLMENSEKFKTENIEVEVDVPEGLYCHCDKDKLMQILWNLFRNSMDAMSDKGRISLSATEVVRRNQEFIQFCIKDSGSGIDSETLTKIFDPFYTTKATGTGLGLSLVFQFVQSHGGRIWAKSDCGEGTEVYFELLKGESVKKKSLEVRINEVA